MNELVWAKKEPEVEGWYWHRCEDGVDPIIEFVQKKYIGTEFLNSCDDCEWAGPIQMPKEPK